MPIISDEELANLKSQLREAEEQKRAANYTHAKKLQNEKENAKKFQIASIILGIIAFLGIAGVAYFMFFQADSPMSQQQYTEKIQSLEEEVHNLKERNQELSMNADLTSDPNTELSENQPSVTDRIIYTVQIGAYKHKNLSLYSDNLINFREIKEGEFNKYSIGTFSTLNEAKKFRREMVKLGFKNAFIASYKNNKRIRIEEAW